MVQRLWVALEEVTVSHQNKVGLRFRVYSPKVWRSRNGYLIS